MSSKRALRRRSCERKMRHVDEAHARSFVFDGMHPYRCRHCHGWHVGHVPKRVRQAIAARRIRE